MKQVVSILGCGWLGEPLAKYLKNLGYQIKGSTTSINKLKNLETIGISPFLINLESIPSNILKFLISEILVVNVPSKNIGSFKNLISKIETSSVKKVVLISSTSVYANSNEILTEQTQLKSSPLVEIEQLFKTNPSFSTTVIRFGGLFGYNRKPGMFFHKGKKIGNPEGFINMIHRDDCVCIIEQVIKKSLWNETLNACADTHPKRRDFYIKSALDIGLEKPIFNEVDTFEYKIISNQKLKTLLNYRFKYPDLLKINQ